MAGGRVGHGVGLLERLLEEVDLGGIQRGRGGRGVWSTGGVDLAELLEAREEPRHAVVLRHLLGRRDDVVEAGLPGEDLADLVLLGLDVELAHERGGVAERRVGLLLLLEELG